MSVKFTIVRISFQLVLRPVLLVRQLEDRKKYGDRVSHRNENGELWNIRGTKAKELRQHNMKTTITTRETISQFYQRRGLSIDE